MRTSHSIKSEMKFINLSISATLIFLIICSCKVSKKPVAIAPLPEVQEDTVSFDTIPAEEKYEIKLYKGEKTRHFELKHTRLHIALDWEKQQVIGKAGLILSPYFYPQSTLVLDAKNFDFNQIKLIQGEDSLALDYSYNGYKVIIDLGKQFSRSDNIHVFVDYTAKPNESYDTIAVDGGKKGFYFINPSREESKPQQFWTHGETESNSRWFPTLDAPNQKTTQEIFITADQKFATLSNGLLIYSKSNPDSTRTDYWKMDKPHASYLIMLAGGEFEKTSDTYGDLPVDYYMEPGFSSYAEDIFENTPEMIEYFSELLGYPYPWPKYSQIVVRDFVSGAMENTTASVFMEELNVSNRELLDYNWDDIIAHELFHQWFGDLVTCESWANLPLNESFATYSEYLWKGHKYGKHEGDFHLHEELQTYLDESKTKKVNLIRFDHIDDDDMFDSHSYAKGALILHMLRNYLGDEAFFESLSYYLHKNEFGKVEIHDLRMAFEHVAGEDLNWFFNQWFLSAGHPELKVEEQFVSDQNKHIVKIWQTQNTDSFPIFKLPINLDYWQNDRKEQYLIEIDRPYQEFEFDATSKPDLVLVDSEFILVGEIDHAKTEDELLFQFENYPENVRAKNDALEKLLTNGKGGVFRSAVEKALKDEFWIFREKVLYAIGQDTTGTLTEMEPIIEEMAVTEKIPLVKAASLAVLSSIDRPEYKQIFIQNIYDSSYSVSGNALYAFLKNESALADSIEAYFADETNFNITSTLADFYIKNQIPDKFMWFKSKFGAYSGSDLWYFIKLFGMYLISVDEKNQNVGIQLLANIALNHPQFFNRLSAYQSLQLLSDNEGVSELLLEIEESEADPRVSVYFE